MPEVKIRNLDPDTLSRLHARAEANQRSLEAELRAVLSEAVSADGISAADWESTGFEQVDVVQPGRIYDAWGDGRHFRIYISLGVVSSNTTLWHSEIDEAVLVGDHRVWTSPVGIPARHFGDTSAQALGDAIRWLADWARIDEKGRAQRRAEAAQHMEPALRAVVEWIDEYLGDDVDDRDRDDHRAWWSSKAHDYFVSRVSTDEFTLMIYTHRKPHRLVQPPTNFPLTREGAYQAADAIRAMVL